MRLEVLQDLKFNLEMMIKILRYYMIDKQNIEPCLYDLVRLKEVLLDGRYQLMHVQ